MKLMELENMHAELQSLRLDLEHISGIAHVQSLIIRELLKADPSTRERVARYASLAKETNYGGGFTDEQCRAIEQALKGCLQ